MSDRAFCDGNKRLHQQNQRQTHWQLTRRGRVNNYLMTIASKFVLKGTRLLVGDSVNYDDVVWNDDWNATLQVTEATTASSKNTLLGNTATTSTLVNCISFALSDQPIED